MTEAERLQALKIEMRQDYAAAVRQWETTQDLITGDYSILPPVLQEQGHYEVRMQTCKNWVNLLAADLKPSPEDIQIEVEPMNDTVKEKDLAEKVETGYKETLTVYAKDMLIDPLREDLRNLIAFDKACERVLPIEEEAWGKRPVRREGEEAELFEMREHEWEIRRKTNFPIQTVPLNPLTYYDNASMFPPTKVMEYGTKTVGYIREMWNDEKILADHKASDYVEYLVYAGPDRRSTIADNQVITSVPNILGLPYVIALGGNGMPDYKGRKEREQVGMIYDFKDTFEEERRWATAVSVIIQKYAFQQAMSDDPTSIRLPLFPGDIGFKPKDTWFEWLEQPRVMQDLWNYIGFIQKQQEQGSRIKLLSGNNPGSNVGSGQFEGMLLEQAEKTYEPILNALKKIIQGRLWRIGYYCDKIIREPILRHSKMGPSMLRGYYECIVKFETKNIIAKRAEIMLVKALLNNDPPIISREYAWDILGVENKSEMEQQIIIEQIFGGQPVQIGLARAAMKKRGIDDVIEKGKDEAGRLNKGTGAGAQGGDVPMNQWEGQQLKDIVPLAQPGGGAMARAVEEREGAPV